MPSRSGSIATANKAQQLSPYNASRKVLKGQNTSAGDLYINEIGPNASNTNPDSYRVGPGETFSITGVDEVSIWGATQGQTFVATEN